MSPQARGTLARILTFMKTARGAILKKRSAPSGPPTFNQLYRRWMFSFLQANWNRLGNVLQETWSVAAQLNDISNNNAYLATNMERWDRFNVPSAYLPIAHTGSPGTVKNWLADAQGPRIHLRVRAQPIDHNWGCILYAEYTSPPTHSRQYVIQVHLLDDDLLHSFYFYPETPGTYKFALSLFSHNGERLDHPTIRTVVWP